LVRVWETQRDITEQKNAEHTLTDNEERYRALVEATSTVVWRANENGELNLSDRLGRRLAGSESRKCSVPAGSTLFTPTTVSRRLNLAARAYRQKHLQNRISRLDDKRRISLVRRARRSGFEHDGTVREWVGANTDVHERKLAEEKVRESEARFRQMADTLP
jgi:PAS domain-containing protein